MFSALSASVMLIFPGCFPDCSSSTSEASHRPGQMVLTLPRVRLPFTSR